MFTLSALLNVSFKSANASLGSWLKKNQIQLNEFVEENDRGHARTTDSTVVLLILAKAEMTVDGSKA